MDGPGREQAMSLPVRAPRHRITLRLPASFAFAHFAKARRVRAAPATSERYPPVQYRFGSRYQGL